MGRVANRWPHAKQYATPWGSGRRLKGLRASHRGPMARCPQKHAMPARGESPKTPRRQWGGMTIPMAGAPPTPSGDALTPKMKQELDELVQSNAVVLFMKGTPDQPMCGFSARAVEALEQSGYPYHAVNVLEYGDNPYQTIPALAQWAEFPTLPQVWVKGELVGGSDIILDMVQHGELKQMMEA